MHFNTSLGNLQYEKAAQILSQNDPPVILAKVDANEEQNKILASEFDIKGFPTIKILRYGGSVVQDYKGPREADGIVSYLKKQSGPASAEIKSADDVIDVNKIIIVSALPSVSLSLYMCTHTQTHAHTRVTRYTNTQNCSHWFASVFLLLL